MEQKVAEIATKRDCDCKLVDVFSVLKKGDNYLVYLNGKIKLFWTNKLKHLIEFFEQRDHLFNKAEFNEFINDLKSLEITEEEHETGS